MQGTLYGYARVSTEGQSAAGQVKQLRAAGAVSIVTETASEAKTERAGLRKAITALEAGDLLMVTRLNRLACSTLDLFHTRRQITKRGAGFRSLAEEWANTSTAQSRLILTVLSGLAEFERELIRARAGPPPRRAA